MGTLSGAGMPSDPKYARKPAPDEVLNPGCESLTQDPDLPNSSFSPRTLSVAPPYGPL